MSALSTLVSNLNDIENILISAIEELGVSTEDVEPNSQSEILNTQFCSYDEYIGILGVLIPLLPLSGKVSEMRKTRWAVLE